MSWPLILVLVNKQYLFKPETYYIFFVNLYITHNANEQYDNQQEKSVFVAYLPCLKVFFTYALLINIKPQKTYHDKLNDSKKFIKRFLSIYINSGLLERQNLYRYL